MSNVRNVRITNSMPKILAIRAHNVEPREKISFTALIHILDDTMSSKNI